jgi:MEDS: MEthanogen/methylotroph, DcmR Sensory domain
MESINTNESWKQVKADVFWGEIATHDHVLQIYENEGVFLDTLTGFVSGGIDADDACIVIATDHHLTALEKRLKSYGVNIEALIDDNRYIPLNAEETLSIFMINGWPDEDLFNQTISTILMTARSRTNRRIRAFGEMVAILWAKGKNAATARLEHLWNKFCEKETLCLFCAYPKSVFTKDITGSMNHICCAHSKLIGGSEKQLTEVFYKEMIQREAV